MPEPMGDERWVKHRWQREPDWDSVFIGALVVLLLPLFLVMLALYMLWRGARWLILTLLSLETEDYTDEP